MHRNYLITAVALFRPLRKLTTLHPQIKWPNDILVNGKKVTGILTELQAESDRINSVIIGIGMNVNQESNSYPGRDTHLLPLHCSLKVEKR